MPMQCYRACITALLQSIATKHYERADNSNAVALLLSIVTEHGDVLQHYAQYRCNATEHALQHCYRAPQALVSNKNIIHRHHHRHHHHPTSFFTIIIIIHLSSPSSSSIIVVIIFMDISNITIMYTCREAFTCTWGSYLRRIELGP